MILDKDSPIRMYNKGYAYYDSGCIYEWQPGKMPEYTGWADEEMSWKTDCYLGDWTLSLTDLWISGKDAIRFFEDTCSNSFAKFPVGVGKHYMMCHDDGTVAAEGILLRLGEDQYCFQSNIWFPYYRYITNKDRYPDLKVEIPEAYPYGGQINLVAKLFKFQIQGPKALALAEKVTGKDLKSIKFMHFEEVEILGHKCIALRQGMSGEIGFEIQGPIEHGKEIYQHIFEMGEEFNCRRLGTRTSMINHLEACYPTGGVHFLPPVMDDYYAWQQESWGKPFMHTVYGSYDGDISYLACNPYELDWGMCVKFDHDFIGRDALEKLNGTPARKVVTLELNSQDMVEIYASLFDTEQEPFEILDVPMSPNFAMQADKILDENGSLIGFASTPGYSLYFRKILSLSVIETKYSTPGTQVQVLWGSPGKRQRLIRATVAPAPYKQDNRKVDLNAAPKQK